MSKLYILLIASLVFVGCPSPSKNDAPKKTVAKYPLNCTYQIANSVEEPTKGFCRGRYVSNSSDVTKMTFFLVNGNSKTKSKRMNKTKNTLRFFNGTSDAHFKEDSVTIVSEDDKWTATEVGGSEHRHEFIFHSKPPAISQEAKK